MTALSIEKKKPLSVRIMQKLGFRHVPDNKLQVIERHGRYHRAVANTFVRRNLFSESFGPQIHLGVRLVERTYENIMSRDGVAHKISVSVKVFFDLRRADPKIAPVIVQNGERLVDNRIAALVELTLRRKIEPLDSTKLLLPGMAENLESAIKQRLRSLENMGVSLLPTEDGLMVKEILPPERMQENRMEATNIDETITSFARQRHSEQVKQALLAHLLRDMGKQRPQFRNLNLPEDLNPASDNVLDASFRVLRGPTGKIYNN